MPGPKLVVDNEQAQAALERRAIRRLKRLKPNHTYDDVLAEVERIKNEEGNDKNPTDV